MRFRQIFMLLLHGWQYFVTIYTNFPVEDCKFKLIASVITLK